MLRSGARVGSLRDGLSTSGLPEERVMNSLRTLAAHAVTVVVTLMLASVLFGIRPSAPRPQRQPTPVPIAERSRPAEPPPKFEQPSVPPPALPPKVLEEADAEEQVNVQVYAAANRSVVHITTAMESVGFFGEETSSGSGSGFVIDRQGHILTNYH